MIITVSDSFLTYSDRRAQRVARQFFDQSTYLSDQVFISIGR